MLMAMRRAPSFVSLCLPGVGLVVARIDVRERLPVARAYPQACRSMCGCALISSPAPPAARSIIRAKPAAVKGGAALTDEAKGDAGLSS
jgi:hypothetical protein